MIRGLALLVLALAFLSGCAGDGEGGTDTDTTTEPAETTTVSVYFLLDDKVWPVAREIPSTGMVNGALAALVAGPTEQERDELGLTTAIPEDTETLEVVPVADAVPQLEASAELSDEALAQVAYTVTQFPPEVVVAYQGETLRRFDFEEYTPQILVESPLAFEEVTSPIRATGTANTFEANFQYEVLDPDGEIVDENFVTATSGTGTRGTFAFTTADFTVSSDGEGSLVVFESSAEDGSRINEVAIPLGMSEE